MVIVVAAMLISGQAAGAPTARSSDGSFSISIPIGWEVADPGQKYFLKLKPVSGGNSGFVIGPAPSSLNDQPDVETTLSGLAREIGLKFGTRFSSTRQIDFRSNRQLFFRVAALNGKEYLIGVFYGVRWRRIDVLADDSVEFTQMILSSYRDGALLDSSDLRNVGNAGAFGLSLNYPGVGVRYFLDDAFSTEAKCQVGDGVLVVGMRLSRYFNPRSRLMVFAGLEASYVHYGANHADDPGVAGELFLGGELVISRNLSLQMDFGPTYIYLKNASTALSADSISYVVNFGVNFYFGKGLGQ